MGDVVLRAINTETRRLCVGDPVSETDDLAPHTFAGLKERGFIGSQDQPAPARFARAAAIKGDDE